MCITPRQKVSCRRYVRSWQQTKTSSLLLRKRLKTFLRTFFTSFTSSAAVDEVGRDGETARIFRREDGFGHRGSGSPRASGSGGIQGWSAIAQAQALPMLPTHHPGTSPERSDDANLRRSGAPGHRYEQQFRSVGSTIRHGTHRDRWDSGTTVGSGCLQQPGARELLRFPSRVRDWDLKSLKV